MQSLSAVIIRRKCISYQHFQHSRQLSYLKLMFVFLRQMFKVSNMFADKQQVAFKSRQQIYELNSHFD